MPRARHVPERTCIGCRLVRPATELVCLIAPQGRVRVACRGKGTEATEKLAGERGRGAWVHPHCWGVALKIGALARAFRKHIDIEGGGTLLAQIHVASGRTTKAQGDSR